MEGMEGEGDIPGLRVPRERQQATGKGGLPLVYVVIT